MNIIIDFGHFMCYFHGKQVYFVKYSSTVYFRKGRWWCLEVKRIRSPWKLREMQRCGQGRIVETLRAATLRQRIRWFAGCLKACSEDRQSL